MVENSEGSINKNLIILILAICLFLSFLRSNVFPESRAFFSLLNLIPFAALSGVYIFLHRVSTTQQVKSIKSINDLLIKINENCIEIFCSDDSKSEKIKIQKVRMLLSFLRIEITNFPFGGPISNILYSFSLLKLEKTKALRNYLTYFDEINYNTIIENSSADVLTDRDEVEEKLSKIVHLSIEVSKGIEVNHKKWF